MQNFTFEKDDIVVTLWPEITRYCFIQDDKSVKHLGIWYYNRREEETKLYKDMFTETHAKYDFDLFDSFANMHFDKLGIRYLDYIGPYFYADVDKFKMELIDKGTDNKHPGKESHSKFAHKVYHDIKEI